MRGLNNQRSVGVLACLFGEEGASALKTIERRSKHQDSLACLYALHLAPSMAPTRRRGGILTLGCIQAVGVFHREPQSFGTTISHALKAATAQARVQPLQRAPCSQKNNAEITDCKLQRRRKFCVKFHVEVYPYASTLRRAEDGIFVTAARVQQLLAAAAAAGGGADMIQFISAFDVPKILYDPIRKSFYRAPAPTSLLGTAQARYGPQLAVGVSKL